MPAVIIDLMINTALLLFFSYPHTKLLDPAVRKKMAMFFPSALFFTLYSLHACVGLLLLDWLWRPLPGLIYQLQGVWAKLFYALYLASWVSMVWSMLATDALHHIGLKQWWNYLSGKSTPYELPQKGPYRFCRHPIFLSFAGMIWFTPTMTLGHLYLSLFWSGYLIIGTLNKEKRLLKSKEYSEYKKVVPLYPFWPLGEQAPQKRRAS